MLEVVLHPEHRKAYEKRFRREQQKLLGLLDDVDRNRVQILAALTTLRRHALDSSFAGTSGPSAKLEALGGLIDEVVAEGHRVLVFSQFTEFLGLAATVAEDRGVPYAYLDGSTTQRRRAAMIDRFVAGDVPVFFISLKAGGVGLNLTAADYCILLDPWWNPAAEAQAVDRAHRIGQDRPGHGVSADRGRDHRAEGRRAAGEEATPVPGRPRVRRRVGRHGTHGRGLPRPPRLTPRSAAILRTVIVLRMIAA
ncbi:hypothetical protein GCM10027064_19790 [Microbacterium petrolearium]